MLSFVHLSDIHFRKCSGDRYDIDEDLRNELIYDISHRLLKQIPHIDGILICGDIAFSGQEAEYDVASRFLEAICNSLDLDRSRIFCVPGNHDVNQQITQSTFSVKALQDELERTKSIAEYDDTLAKIFRNAQDLEVLYSPIMCYNEKFAAQYGCSFAPDKLIWMQEMDLDFDHKLCIVGLNSTVISNHEDHKEDHTERLMRIGDMQIPSRKEKTIYLSLCHHPPECWYDPENKLSEKMNKRIAVQLYGHKHTQAIETYDDALIIRSGATHPSRFEDGWVPRYNWISIQIDRSTEKNRLRIIIYPRVLNGSETSFEADDSILEGKEYLEHFLDLPDEDMKKETERCLFEEKTPVLPVLDITSWERRFIYDFLNLPFTRREFVLKKLSLGRPEDEGIKHIKLLDRIIDRAKEQDCVSRLVRETEAEKERIER